MGKERKEGEEANEGRVGYLHVTKTFLKQCGTQSHTYGLPSWDRIFVSCSGAANTVIQWLQELILLLKTGAHGLLCLLKRWSGGGGGGRGGRGGEGGREEEQVIIGVSNLLGETHTKCCYHWNRSGDYRKLAVEQPG